MSFLPVPCRINLFEKKKPINEKYSGNGRTYKPKVKIEIDSSVSNSQRNSDPITSLGNADL